jgi:hypothetical protein
LRHINHKRGGTELQRAVIWDMKLARVSLAILWPLRSVELTGGYCWPTPKCRNLCIQHAFFEGKKVEETSLRKSTSRTLKEVGQQYRLGF